ncbi:MAG: hypothetical protein WCT18_04315 [Patescibacteria group bacterium]
MNIAVEKIKESVEKVIGRQDRVEFRNDVRNYAVNNGVVINVAEKQIFQKNIDELLVEYRRNGIVSVNNEQWKKIIAGMDETLYPSLREKIKKDADPASGKLRNIPSALISSVELQKVEKHFKDKFAGQKPEDVVCREVTAEMKALAFCAQRFNNDLRLGLYGAFSLADFISRTPEVGADLGFIFQLKEMISKHENKFHNLLEFKKEKENLKNQGKEAVYQMFWRLPIDWTVSATKNSWAMLTKRNFAPMGKFLREALTGLAKSSKCFAKTFASALSLLQKYFKTLSK